MSVSQTHDELTEVQRAFADALLVVGAVKFGARCLRLRETQPHPQRRVLETAA